MDNLQLPLPPTLQGGSPQGTKLGSNVINHSKSHSFLKVIVTNNLVEIYTPETPYLLNRPPIINHSNHKGITEDRPKEREAEYKRRAINKAYNKVKRLAVANFGSIPHAKFITLTFSDTKDFDISNIGDCNKKLIIFMQRLKRLHKELLTLTIVEYQKRGAVHYHILSNIAFIHWSKLQAMWEFGGLTIEEVKDANHLGTYITKYFTKNANDPRLKGYRLYHASKNLSKPRIFYHNTAKKIKWFLEKNNIQSRFESTYQSEKNGNIGFREYLLDFPCSKIYE